MISRGLNICLSPQSSSQRFITRREKPARSQQLGAHSTAGALRNAAHSNWQRHHKSSQWHPSTGLHHVPLHLARKGAKSGQDLLRRAFGGATNPCLPPAPCLLQPKQFTGIIFSPVPDSTAHLLRAAFGIAEPHHMQVQGPRTSAWSHCGPSPARCGGLGGVGAPPAPPQGAQRISSRLGCSKGAGVAEKPHYCCR